MLKEKVLKTIKKFQLVPKGSKVLVALSGGPDSVTLLHVLLSLKEELQLQVFAAHLNHMLRGEESERDEKFVKELCKKWNVPLLTGKVNVKELSKGKNVEAVAREVRYKFLQEKLKEVNGDLIATGHTASDLLETVLLNLVKGTGIKGLRGFLPKRDRVVRPLFEVTREEVEAYVKEKGLPFVIDSSNLSTEYERNLLRLKVVPVLKEINPSLETAILRTTEILRDVEEFLELSVEPLLRESLKEGKFCIPLTEFKKLHDALKKELITRAYKTLTGESLSYENVSSVISLLRKEGYKEVELGKGFIACRDQRELCIQKKEEGEVKPFYFVVRELPAKVHTPIGILFFEKDKGEPIVSYEEFKKKGITVRSRKPGDRLIFRKFSKPLKKFLIEKKVPAKKRDKLPIVISGDRIIWIPDLYRAYINDTYVSYVGVRLEKSDSKSSNTGRENKTESSGTC
jgi:tRNA(Ile)-lysidine synthase